MNSNLYTSEFYETYKSISLEYADKLISVLLQYYQPKSVIDFGCGIATWLNVFNDKGIPKESLYGIEGDWVKSAAKSLEGFNLILHDISKYKKFNIKTDLAMSLEVAEHVPEKSSDTFVDMITECSDTIMFGAAFKDQPGTGHINCKYPREWGELFKDKGYKVFDLFRPELWGPNKGGFYYVQNTFLYTKNEELITTFKDNHIFELNNLWFMDCMHPELHRILLRDALGDKR
jgi:hypothetical protein